MASYSGAASTFLSDAFESVNNALQTFVTSFSANIASEITPIVILGLTLSFIMMGILAVRGMLDRPFTEVAYKMFIFGIITSIALTSAVYQQYIVDSLLTLPDDLISSIVATSVSGTSGSNVVPGQGAAKAIEQLYDLGAYNASLYTEQAGISMTDGFNFTPYLLAIFVFAGTVMCVIVGALWLFVSKILLALMLAVGPIFIVALAWDNTRQFFFSWLSVVLNTIITSVFVVAVFSIFATFFQANLQALQISEDNANFLDAGIFLFLGLLCMGVLMLIPQYVTQLTGASAGAVGQAVGGILSKAGGGAKSAANGGLNTIRAGFAGKSAQGEYKEARANGASRFDAARGARHEYNKSMAEMKQGYPDYFRKTKSREQK